MFGTNDVIYVPEGGLLVYDDLYRWKRFKFDVRRAGVRIHPAAYETVANSIRAALETCRKSPRFAGMIGDIDRNASEMLRALAEYSGSAEEALQGSVQGDMKSPDAVWWIRLTDLPAESFYDEDYERQARAEGGHVTPYRIFGNAKFAQLDGLEVELPGDDETGMPYGLILPSEGGFGRFAMPPLEPIALVQEYCGVHGASAFGRTVNITTQGEIAESHQFCTPIGKIGEKLHATLYFHDRMNKEAEVCGPLPAERLGEYQALLEKSKFELANEGPTWRIYARGKDAVHLYDGLAGKEAEGIETMAPLLLVASAGGDSDPLLRGELFQSIKNAVNYAKG